MVMRAAIISAGPSVVETYDPAEPFDVRIAVNAAAQLYEADWWSAADPVALTRYQPKGKPRLLVLRSDPARYTDCRETYDALRAMDWAELRAAMPDAPRWRFSVTAALMLARHLGACELHVFGHDMDGLTDCAGFRFAKRAKAWKKMPKEWKAIEQYLAARHVLICPRRAELARCP